MPVVDRIHPQSNKFAMGVENKATGETTLKPLKIVTLQLFDILECLVVVWHWHLQQVLHILPAYKVYKASISCSSLL